MIRVLVNGAKGKMGQEAALAISKDEALTLVGETDAGDDLERSIRALGAQVVVDFTNATSGVRNTQLILESGARPVIGTSGFKQSDVDRLQRIAAEKNLGGVIAPNFAIGAVLMMKFAQEASRYLPEVEIIELHHEQKTDSPSGTALRTAELIASARGAIAARASEHEIVPSARGANFENVRIHSIRLPGYVAQQQVLLAGSGQTLTLTHNSTHRESFMAGVCLACRKAPVLEKLFFGLEHLL